MAQNKNTRCPTEETIQLPSVFFSTHFFSIQEIWHFITFGAWTLFIESIYSFSDVKSLLSPLLKLFFYLVLFISHCSCLPTHLPLLNSSYASSKDRREIDCLLGSQAFERFDHPCTEGLLAFERCVPSTHICG